MQPTADLPTPVLTGGDVTISPGLVLPLPDDAAAAAARERLSTVDIGVPAPTVAALGMLTEPVVFVAAVQGSAYPRPFLSTRVVLLTGSHAGGVVAGPTPDPRHGIPLQQLAVTASAGIVTLEWQPASAAIELEDAITPDQADDALRAGWAEAERAADEGIELMVLAAGGGGAATAAAAVIAAVTGVEPTLLLSRVVTPAGYYDDNAWMTRCLALRDALHRVRRRDGDPRTVLAALGGADLAAATGLILGAASRRTPIMIDGPVGAAAALLANDFSPQSRSWVVLPDTGRHPAVRLAADALQLRPWLDLCLDLGEGASALAAIPMLQTALTLAGAGEAVEPAPLSRYDSSGNQVFVGVARPVDPVESEDGSNPESAPESESDPTPAYSGTTMETASVVYTSALARGGSENMDTGQISLAAVAASGATKRAGKVPTPRAADRAGARSGPVPPKPVTNDAATAAGGDAGAADSTAGSRAGSRPGDKRGNARPKSAGRGPAGERGLSVPPVTAGAPSGSADSHADSAGPAGGDAADAQAAGVHDASAPAGAAPAAGHPAAAPASTDQTGPVGSAAAATRETSAAETTPTNGAQTDGAASDEGAGDGSTGDVDTGNGDTGDGATGAGTTDNQAAADDATGDGAVGDEPAAARTGAADPNGVPGADERGLSASARRARQAAERARQAQRTPPKPAGRAGGKPAGKSALTAKTTQGRTVPARPTPDGESYGIDSDQGTRSNDRVAAPAASTVDQAAGGVGDDAADQGGAVTLTRTSTELADLVEGEGERTQVVRVAASSTTGHRQRRRD